MRLAGRRGAFTLVEVIVALAVILILAAVAVPQLGGYLDQKRIEETAALMVEIRNGLTSFATEVGDNAGQLSYLSAPIVNGDQDLCGSAYSGGERGDWIDGGPYVNFVIDPVAGLATPIGQVENDLDRVTGGGTWLRITWNNTVTLVDAQAFDLYVDGVLNGGTGTVRWTPQAGTDMATVNYDIPISGC
jgi:prepilin-type N-terminal cleavage/methylation domain-containing protein